jgi:hypothetical protein
LKGKSTILRQLPFLASAILFYLFKFPNSKNINIFGNNSAILRLSHFVTTSLEVEGVIFPPDLLFSSRCCQKTKIFDDLKIILLFWSSCHVDINANAFGYARASHVNSKPEVNKELYRTDFKSNFPHEPKRIH